MAKKLITVEMAKAKYEASLRESLERSLERTDAFTDKIAQEVVAEVIGEELGARRDSFGRWSLDRTGLNAQSKPLINALRQEAQKYFKENSASIIAALVCKLTREDRQQINERYKDLVMDAVEEALQPLAEKEADRIVAEVVRSTSKKED
jgi:hypothetical protein